MDPGSSYKKYVRTKLRFVLFITPSDIKNFVSFCRDWKRDNFVRQSPGYWPQYIGMP